MEIGEFPFPGVTHAGYPEMVRRVTRVKEDSGARPEPASCPDQRAWRDGFWQKTSIFPAVFFFLFILLLLWALDVSHLGKDEPISPPSCLLYPDNKVLSFD